MLSALEFSPLLFSLELTFHIICCFICSSNSSCLCLSWYFCSSSNLLWSKSSYLITTSDSAVSAVPPLWVTCYYSFWISFLASVRIIYSSSNFLALSASSLAFFSSFALLIAVTMFYMDVMGCVCIASFFLASTSALLASSYLAALAILSTSPRFFMAFFCSSSILSFLSLESPTTSCSLKFSLRWWR